MIMIMIINTLLKIIQPTMTPYNTIPLSLFLSLTLILLILTQSLLLLFIIIIFVNINNIIIILTKPIITKHIQLIYSR